MRSNVKMCLCCIVLYGYQWKDRPLFNSMTSNCIWTTWNGHKFLFVQRKSSSIVFFALLVWQRKKKKHWTNVYFFPWNGFLLLFSVESLTKARREPLSCRYLWSSFTKREKCVLADLLLLWIKRRAFIIWPSILFSISFFRPFVCGLFYSFYRPRHCLSWNQVTQNLSFFFSFIFYFFFGVFIYFFNDNNLIRSDCLVCLAISRQGAQQTEFSIQT